MFSLCQTVWHLDGAYGTAMFYCFTRDVSYRYIIKEKWNQTFLRPLLGVVWCNETPLFVFSRRTIGLGEISSALAVRDDSVFGGQTIDNWKWLLQVFLYLWCR